MKLDLKKKSNIGWNFDNSYIHLPEKLYSRQAPNPVASPSLVVFNEELAKDLGLDPDELQGDKGAEIFAGNSLPKGATPIAQAYAGHQFGHFTMLGDGRAILLGEHISPMGERVDVQLKGSGLTPYSRGGDGRAALGPMLREYIISQAMHKLKVPTSRSLAVVTTGETIVREGYLPGAILTRIATSHIRVGTFQYIATYGNVEELQLLAEYTLQRHFPDLAGDEDRYLLLLREVIKSQAELIASWQLVGFIHGVMNTDNMTISGETIDYGPCAFMDIYDPETVFSSIDRQGRYAYGNQPKIAAWNLARFAETLLPLIDGGENQVIDRVSREIESFSNIYNQAFLKGMRKKLGIFNEGPEDQSIIEELFNIMYKYKADFTNTFRGLTLDQVCGMDLFNSKEFIVWKDKWQARLGQQQESRDKARQLMKDNNPAIIPRNHRVEEALETAVEHKDYGVMERLLETLSNPYAYSPMQEEYAKLPPQSTQAYRTFCGT